MEFIIAAGAPGRQAWGGGDAIGSDGAAGRQWI